MIKIKRRVVRFGTDSIAVGIPQVIRDTYEIALGDEVVFDILEVIKSPKNARDAG